MLDPEPDILDPQEAENIRTALDQFRRAKSSMLTSSTLNAPPISEKVIRHAGRYQIVYTRLAAQQIQEVFEYIERDSPQNATSFIARMLDAIESLSILPHRYREIEDPRFVGEQVRSMPVLPYLIRYRIDNLRVH